MKLKLLPLVSVAIFLSGGLFSVAFAQEDTHGNATSSAAQAREHGNATSTEARDNEDNATSTDANENDNDEFTAESHRSTVAAFVHSLLDVADREDGIGAQIRIIAQAQNDEASTSAEAITKVRHKGAFSTFLFGSDYTSLGQLRSEMVTTQHNIDQLKSLLTQATNNTDKAELAAQIKVLEDSQVKLNAFITTHENSFSLFGWFARMFVR